MGKGFAVVNTLWAAVACLALAGIVPAAGAAAETPHMMYFYNPTCRLCTKTNEVIAAAEEKYKTVLSSQRFNIADNETGMDNVLYMFQLLDEMRIPEDDTVTLVVFLGLLGEENGETYFTPTRALVDGERIIEKLDGEIADFLAKEAKAGGPIGFAPPAALSSFTALASPADPGSGPSAGQMSGEEEGQASRPRIRPRNAEPADAGQGEAADVSRAESRLRFGAVSAAALADSINPCAFATIIILVAMMSSAKRSKGEIIAVCLAFTASVYVTYFAIGLFLYKVIAEINSHGGWFLVAADIIYYLAFALCAVFAVLSLRDAFMLFRGRAAEEMTLQLPKAFKKRINVAMARGVRARWLVAGVFAAGVTVSFLEAACTGQVYLPAIITIAKMSFWGSMALLAWYNLLFILPLLVIFGLVLVGITSAQLADFFKKNVAWTKLALGIVFVAMGAIIWFEMYWPPGYRG